jgi:hypothetical protein
LEVHASRPSRFTPGETDPGTHWIGGWVGLRAGLYDVEKILDPTGIQDSVQSRAFVNTAMIFNMPQHNFFYHVKLSKVAGYPENYVGMLLC